jgi:photosystem II stability/assembly factor-like uncharacterized protein
MQTGPLRKSLAETKGCVIATNDCITNFGKYGIIGIYKFFSMMQKIIFFVLVSVFLTGCTQGEDLKKEKETPQYSIKELSGGVIRSLDGGESFDSFVASQGDSLLKSQVYSLNVSYGGRENLYMGTQKDGLFRKEADSDVWEKLSFPVEKIYAMEVFYDDATGEDIIYASGVYEGRGKIYKSLAGGRSVDSWEEIYTEPANNTVILSLASNGQERDVIYAGTSEGVVIKTEDGGKTWKNIQDLDDPVFAIELDSEISQTAYFLLYQDSIAVSRDGGKTLVEEKNISSRESDILTAPGGSVFSMAVDSRISGVLYAGTDQGVFRSNNFGETWERLKVIESIGNFPIRSLAVSPFSSQELMFGVARVLYKSVDGGESWSTYQLDADATPAHIVYHPSQSGLIFVGLRNF